MRTMTGGLGRHVRSAALAAIAASVLIACGRLGVGAPSDAAGAGDADPDGPAPELDGDGDGVADAVDNCPAIANAGQPNEDGDRFGDACDPCPPYVDAGTVADDDGDGVGNGCDPFPQRPGDRIAVFDGFASAPTTAEIAGTWMFMSGAALSASRLAAISAVTWIVPDAGQQTVTALGTLDIAFGDRVARPVGVVQQFNAATADGLTCVFGINPANQQVFAVADNRNNQALDDIPAVAGEGATSTFILTQTGTSYRCSGSAATRELRASLALPGPNRLGVFTKSASAHFAWVMIVSSL